MRLELSDEHVEVILNALASQPLRDTISAFLAVQQQVRDLQPQTEEEKP